MPVTPIILRGHSRPLTCVKFNREGDLLFTCAKDHKPCVWYSDNGERLGTYNGHTGTVWDCDMDWTSKKLLTGSADAHAILFDLESGKELYRWRHPSGVRCVAFSNGDQMMMTVTDSTFSSIPSIHIYNLTDNVNDWKDPIRVMRLEDKVTVYQALWSPLNDLIYTACEDGTIRVWSVESGECINTVKVHQNKINSMQFSKDKTMLITASSDMTCNVIDAKSLEVQRSFKTERPLNAAAFSPIFNHIILGGGQEAQNVTVTKAAAGHFEVDFMHVVYGEYLGCIKGHFGPVNTLAFSPNGHSFASGGEDGYVRLHHFDKEYFNFKNY